MARDKGVAIRRGRQAAKAVRAGGRAHGVKRSVIRKAARAARKRYR